jgi:cytochrome c oxidase subunit III
MASTVTVSTPNTTDPGREAQNDKREQGKMQENVLPFPRRLAPKREPIGPNAIVGMLIFVMTEMMMFAGFISAHTITRAAYNTWPPIGQPRLPASATLFNTGALLLSGVLLVVANRAFTRQPAKVRPWLGASLALGLFFVLFQGVEWVQLIKQGLTLSSSNHGAFFYLIVGLHGLHALAAIGALSLMYMRSVQGKLEKYSLIAASIFWYFVVGVWPVLYMRVYL